MMPARGSDVVARLARRIDAERCNRQAVSKIRLARRRRVAQYARRALTRCPRHGPEESGEEAAAGWLLKSSGDADSVSIVKPARSCRRITMGIVSWVQKQ